MNIVRAAYSLILISFVGGRARIFISMESTSTHWGMPMRSRNSHPDVTGTSDRTHKLKVRPRSSLPIAKICLQAPTVRLETISNAWWDRFRSVRHTRKRHASPLPFWNDHFPFQVQVGTVALLPYVRIVFYGQSSWCKFNDSYVSRTSECWNRGCKWRMGTCIFMSVLSHLAIEN